MLVKKTAIIYIKLTKPNMDTAVAGPSCRLLVGLVYSYSAKMVTI